MNYIDNIMLKTGDLMQSLHEFEESIAPLSLGEKIQECQRLNDAADERDLAKLFLLYLIGEDEVRFEIRRVIAWKNTELKTRFLLQQLASSEQSVILKALELIGILKEPLVIPYLNNVFNPKDPAICTQIIKTFSAINDPRATKIIRRAFSSSDQGVIITAIQTLAKWTFSVKWKIFQSLLSHKDPAIRAEACFAIAVRKDDGSVHCLVRAIKKEHNKETHLAMIRHIGMIPSHKVLMPLLTIAVYDEDQKARMAASRTLDRLQGIINPNAVYNLRNIHDVKLCTEVLFRIGKFGTDKEKHKGYLRARLRRAKSPTIVQSCIQALGYIADHSDIDLLSEYLDKDALTAYNAAMALTRIWRMEDKDKILNALITCSSATIRQVILKYMIRRRGASVAPAKILKTVEETLKDDANINVGYLALSLLEFCPLPEALDYLLRRYVQMDNRFEREAILKSVGGIVSFHEDVVMIFLEKCDATTCCTIMPFIPLNLELSFYQRLAKIVMDKYSNIIESEAGETFCSNMYPIFMSRSDVLQAFVKMLPSIPWKRFFLLHLLAVPNIEHLISIEDDIIAMLDINDAEIRRLVMSLLIKIRTPIAAPHLVAIAEANRSPEATQIAKSIVQWYVKEGIL